MLEISHATETATYLGFTIVLGERDLTIFAPDGRRIFGPAPASLSTARRFIRGYRKPTNQEV